MRRVTTPMTHAPMMSGAAETVSGLRRRGVQGTRLAQVRRCFTLPGQGSAWVDIESLPATLTPLFPSPHLFTTRVVGEAGGTTAVYRRHWPDALGLLLVGAVGGLGAGDRPG